MKWHSELFFCYQNKGIYIYIYIYDTKIYGTIIIGEQPLEQLEAKRETKRTSRPPKLRL